MASFFVTGTDTDVGKTFIACALLYQAQTQGWSTLGIKPIAAGCDEKDGQLYNSDAEMLRHYTSIELDYKQTNPVALREPIAPHIAAEKINLALSASQLSQHCQSLEALADILLVEGAGGWLVPINSQETLADLARLLKRPVILVVGLKLGCINHSLLTINAIKACGLRIAGWVANTIDHDMLVVEDNINALTQRISAPCLGVVPFDHEHSIERAASYLNIEPLLGTCSS